MAIAGSSALPMCLTLRGAQNQCVFDHAAALLSGGTVPLTLSSHPGLGIGKKYTNENRHGPWRYIESGMGAAESAVSVRYEDGAYIKLATDDLVFDVSSLWVMRTVWVRRLIRWWWV